MKQQIQYLHSHLSWKVHCISSEDIYSIHYSTKSNSSQMCYKTYIFKIQMLYGSNVQANIFKIPFERFETFSKRTSKLQISKRSTHWSSMKSLIYFDIIYRYDDFVNQSIPINLNHT